MYPVTSYTLSTQHMRQLWKTSLYKIIRKSDGAVRRFTSADGISDFQGELYYPQPAEQADAETPAGFGAGDTEFRGSLGSGPNSITGPDIDARRYDDALVIEYIVDRRRSKLIVETHFYVDEIQHDGALWSATLLTLARELRANRGPTHHSGCTAILGDSRCQATVPEPTGTVTAVSVSDPQLQFTASGLIATDGLYRLGLVTWLTGNNKGTKQRIYANNASGVIQLGSLARRPIVVGDTCKVRQGCDGYWVTCKTVYSNLPNHRGNQFSRSQKELILARGTVS